MNTSEIFATPGLWMGAHPDDIDVLQRHGATANRANHIYVATDGTAGEDLYDPVNRSFVRAGLRRYESMASWAVTGMPDDHQHYGDDLKNPRDGKLMQYIGTVAKQIAEIVKKYDLKQIAGPDYHGFDKHLDHIALCSAGLLAAHNLHLPYLMRTGPYMEEGNLVITGPRESKTKGMAFNASQYPQDVDPVDIPGFGIYNQQLERETYRLITNPGDVLGRLSLR